MSRSTNRRSRALLHESELAHTDPDPQFFHRPMRYDIGLPKHSHLIQDVAREVDLSPPPCGTARYSCNNAKEQLRGEVLSSAAGSGWNLVGAVMKPFRWKPRLGGQFDKDEPELDWGGSFFEDAEDLIQLLAVGHASPGDIVKSCGSAISVIRRLPSDPPRCLVPAALRR